MKKVLVIAHIFPPLGGSGVQRTLKFVKYLKKYGYEPIVVTAGNSSFLLKDPSLLQQIPNDVQVIRVDEPKQIQSEDLQNIFELYKELIIDNHLLKQYTILLKQNASQLLQALLPDQYIIWAMRVIEAIKKEVDLHNIDVVYSTSGPYSDHAVGYYMKTKFNKPWVCDFRDEWSNNPYIDVDKNNLIFKVIQSMEKAFVHTADKVITTTPLAKENYQELFHLSSEKVVTITNGYDELDFSNIINKKKNEKFTIIHNGMLYGIRTPKPLLLALASLINKGLLPKNKIEMKFSYIENGEEWLKESEQLGLRECLTFLDYAEHAVSLQNAVEADVLLLIVGAGEKAKSVYTGKVFEYLRLGKPILSLAPKEGLVDHLIQQTNRGYNVEYDDIEGIAQCILQLYTEWENNQLQPLSIDERVTVFERKNLTRRLAEQFEQVIEFAKNGSRETEQLALIQEEIKNLIHKGMFTQAKYVIQEYEKMFPITAEIYQMKGFIAFNENQLANAEEFFEKALQLQPQDADTLFNLGCLYEVQGLYNRALQNYKSSLEYCREESLKEELCSKIDMITTEFGHVLVKERKRLAFFSIKKGDNFLHDIIKELLDEYEVKKVIVENVNQIEPAMQWADICWFEWCDDVIAYASKLVVAREKKIICRIHKYEVFTNNPLQVHWENVDRLIIVEQHIFEVLETLIPDIHSKVNVSVIKNGLDCKKYIYGEKEKGYKLAYIGRLVYDKNPAMMLQIIKKLVDIDKRYKLFVAGEFQLYPQIKYYWDYQIKALNLENHVIFEGWQSDINSWLEDKNYILATSICESFGYFIAEGMAKGIKPIIHNFPGSKYIYPEKYTWNTVDEAVGMVVEGEYESEVYREYIESNYKIEKQMSLIKDLLVNLVKEENSVNK